MRSAMQIVANHHEELAERAREDLAIRIRNQIVDAWNGGEG